MNINRSYSVSIKRIKLNQAKLVPDLTSLTDKCPSDNEFLADCTGTISTTVEKTFASNIENDMKISFYYSGRRT